MTMAFELITVPCLSDNYAFLMHDPDDGTTLLVDVPEAAPILDVVNTKGWDITHVLLTHHHPDHVQGLPDILANHRPIVIGAMADANRLPDLDQPVSQDDRIAIGSAIGDVYDVSGHTIGHIAVHFAEQGIVFTADSLMALGCGRLFEGSAKLMWNSLNKLRALPDATIVCSGHEYTMANARFAMTVDPDNPVLLDRIARIEQARANGTPTVPSNLGEEKQTNPFLRPDDPAIRKHLGMLSATDAEVFGEIRSRKDSF
jgi:hydroxyacylglutathione hydrolase